MNRGSFTTSRSRSSRIPEHKSSPESAASAAYHTNGTKCRDSSGIAGVSYGAVEAVVEAPMVPMREGDDELVLFLCVISEAIRAI